MIRHARLLTALLPIACSTRPPLHDVTPATTLALVGATIVDVERGTLLRDQTVLIGGNRILSVARMGGLKERAGLSIVRAQGLYVVPGLWDMHVHVMYRQGYDVFGPLFIAQGITGIRDMGNSPMPITATRQLRQRVHDGSVVGPRFVAAGPLLDGPTARWPFVIKLTSPEQARSVVDSLHAEGADFLKVYSDLPADVFAAIAERARQLQLPVVGHVPAAVRASDAAAHGIRSMEHLLGIGDGCAANEADLAAERARLSRPSTAGEPPIDYEAAARRIFSMAERDERKCSSLLAQLRASGTWQVPTLIVHRTSAFPLDSSALLDERLAYIAPAIRSWWRLHPRDTTAEAWTVRSQRYAQDAAMVLSMHRAGIPIMAGSDAPNRFVYPAFSLHEELQALVDAGLTPLDALRAATLEPARFLAATDSLGSVRAGKIADLVLLTANPLEDIRRTQQIAGVVANGRYFPRVALDSLAHGARGKVAR